VQWVGAIEATPSRVAALMYVIQVCAHSNASVSPTMSRAAHPRLEHLMSYR
jgi:hypothetical protein